VFVVGQEDEVAKAHAEEQLQTQDEVLLMPFCSSVMEDGEYSVMMWGGEVSHGVRKIPVPGDFRVQDDFGATDEPWIPPAEVVEIAHQAVNVAVAGWEYARVDFLLDHEHGWCVLELELLEPSLFFRHAPPNQVERLAQHLLLLAREAPPSPPRSVQTYQTRRHMHETQLLRVLRSRLDALKQQNNKLLQRQHASWQRRERAPVVRAALPADSSKIFELVNEAYAVELGDSGLAFKKENRYMAEAETVLDIRQDRATSAFFALHTTAATGIGTVLAGVLRCVVRDDDPRAVDFGPFAVSPHCQGKGMGTKLLVVAEEWARSKGCNKFVIEVVNHRIDLWDDTSGLAPAGFYGRAGFRKVGEAPCDAAHNCDETKVTRPSRFVLLRRDV
jgi:predicted N-acetyltransferase YhbS